MGNYQEASNEYDMLKGCINRIFVTDDKEELPQLYGGAIYHLGQIYRYGEKRLEKTDSERSENATLPGIDSMTEEQWRMFAETVE